MAPKRTAGSPTRAAKKPKMITSMVKPCKSIADAMSKSEVLPPSAKSLLCSMIKAAPVAADSFYADHPGTSILTSMFDSALTSIEAGMSKEIGAAESVLAEANRDMQSLVTLVEMEEKALAEKKDAVAKAKSLLGSSASAMVELKQALTNAQTAQKTIDATFTKQSLEQTTMSTALSTIERLQTADDQAEAMKEASAVMATLRSFNLEESMLSAVPAALGKACSERGEFEKIVIEQLTNALKAKLSDLQTAISAAQSEREQKVATATEKLKAVEDADQQHSACAEALTIAQKEQTDCENKLKVQQLQVKDYVPITEQRKAALQKLTDALDAFKTGPLASFKELCTPPPAVNEALDEEGKAVAEEAKDAAKEA